MDPIGGGVAGTTKKTRRARAKARVRARENVFLRKAKVVRTSGLAP